MRSGWRWSVRIVRSTWRLRAYGDSGAPTPDRTPSCRPGAAVGDGRGTENLSRRDFRGRTVVVDCVTLWCTNFFLRFRFGCRPALDAVKSEFDRLAAQDADFIFVTNEIGLGGVSTDPLQRRFTDLQGWVNQYIAQRAGSVVLMVSGIPIKLNR